jgi:hypothetical protein
VPEKYRLLQNVPNPFNPFTTISYHLPEACDGTLTIYVLTGQKVVTMVPGHQEAGHHRVMWDDRGCASGLYFYRSEAESHVETKMMGISKPTLYRYVEADKGTEREEERRARFDENGTDDCGSTKTTDLHQRPPG